MGEGERKLERFGVEVKSFLIFLKMIFCKIIATSSFIKLIDNDKVLEKNIFEARDPCPLFLFDFSWIGNVLKFGPLEKY